MNSLAVKAAEKRAAYIIDKYQYGIECNTCNYNYKYYAMQSFISECFDVCENPSVTTYNKTLDCSSTIEFIPYSECVSAIQILDCNQSYVTQETVSLEINSYLYYNVITLSGELYIEFSSIVVNGIEYLSGVRKIKLDSDTLITETIGSTTNYIMNIINELNSFNLPGFVFYPADGNKMKIQYPTGTTWQIQTSANGDGSELTFGIRLTKTGVTGLQTSVGGAYSVGPYTGSASVWATTPITSTEYYLC